MHIYISEDAESALRAFQRAQFWVTSVLHAIALYCLIKKTPPQQALIRNYLLFIQTTVIINSFYMDILFEPMPLFPAIAGYYTGLLRDTKIPANTVLAGWMLTCVWLGLSAFMCCFFRHQTLLPDKFKLKKVI